MREINYDEREGVKCSCGRVLKIPALTGLGNWGKCIFKCICGTKYIPLYMGDIMWGFSAISEGKALVFEPDEELKDERWYGIDIDIKEYEQYQAEEK